MGGSGSSRRLRVVSYNIHSSRDDLSALAAVVRALDPDVLAVQEGPRRWRWRAKSAGLAHSFGLVTAAGGLPSLGNAVFTSLRVRIRDFWCLRYPLTAGRHMRGAAFARCEIPGAAPFVVACTHLSTDDAERPGQAAMFQAAVQAEPRLVAGLDLNETPPGPSYRLLTTSLRDAGGAPEQPTFPARDPARRIDFLLLSSAAAKSGLRLLDYRVYAGPGTAEASDHLPVVADLAL